MQNGATELSFRIFKTKWAETYLGLFLKSKWSPSCSGHQWPEARPELGLWQCPYLTNCKGGKGAMLHLVSQIHNLLWTILSRLSPVLDVSQFSGDDATKSSCAVVMQGDKYFQRLVSSQPQRKCIKNYHFKPSSSNLITEHCNGFPQRSIGNCYCCSRGVSEILPATRNKNCCQSWN